MEVGMKLRSILIVLLVALLGASCGSSKSENKAASKTEDTRPLDSPVKLTATISPSFTLAPAFLAKARGYFDQEKLNVDLIPANNQLDPNGLLGHGDYDVVVGAMSAGLFNSISMGINVRVVASEGQDRTTGDTATGLYVRSDLLDSGKVKSVADLKGLKIGGSGGLGTAPSYLTGRFLEQGHLGLHDVQFVALSGPPDILVALRNKSIDAGLVTAPFTKTVEKEGFARRIGNAQAAVGGQAQTGILFGPNLLVKDRRAGIAFLRALMRAAQDLQGDYRSNDALLQQITAVSKIPIDTIKDAPPYVFQPYLALKPQTATDMQKMFLTAGDILRFSSPLPEDQIFDKSINEAAANSLKAGK
jgi:NitT/TauT family transport system substrate-binding protein